MNKYIMAKQKNWDDVLDQFKRTKAYKQCLAKNLFYTFWRWLKGRYPEGVMFKKK